MIDNKKKLLKMFNEINSLEYCDNCDDDVKPIKSKNDKSRLMCPKCKYYIE